MEAYKPTETMWLSTEVWDSVAKAAYPSIKKGAVVRGVGFLIHNSWIDKNSGEERKMFKVRMTKMLNLDEFSDINLAFEGTEDARQSTFGSASSDSGFSSESPDMQDQTSGGKSIGESNNTMGSSYSYRKRTAYAGQGSSSKRKQQPVVEHFRNEVNTLKQEEDDTEQEMATPWWG